MTAASRHKQRATIAFREQISDALGRPERPGRPGHMFNKRDYNISVVYKMIYLPHTLTYVLIFILTGFITIMNFKDQFYFKVP